MTFMDRQHSLTTHFVSIVSAVNIHESTTCTTRTNRHTTIWGQFSQSGEKLVSLMTFMARQHTLTTRFVSMISVMNIHKSTTRTTRTNRHTTIEGQFSQSGEKYLSLPYDIYG